MYIELFFSVESCLNSSSPKFESYASLENGINTPSRQITPEQEIPPESKKRKREPSLILSSIPAAKIVIATTALLDDQW
ncbi:unnamed protein product, partial [Rotaria magnacalcarata]